MAVKPGERPKPGQRREKKHEHGILYLRCFGTFHDGEWLSSDRFTKTKDGHVTLCRECRRYYYLKRRGAEDLVKLAEVRKWLEEVVARCGTIRGAARTMGVTTGTVLKWLGRYKGYEQRRIKRDSVKLILETLGGLRNGSITPVPTNTNHGRRYVYGCAGCGIVEPEDTPRYTPGCKTCEDRRIGRRRREEADPEIQRQQWRAAHARRKEREEAERLTKAA